MPASVLSRYDRTRSHISSSKHDRRSAIVPCGPSLPPGSACASSRVADFSPFFHLVTNSKQYEQDLGAGYTIAFAGVGRELGITAISLGTVNPATRGVAAGGLRMIIVAARGYVLGKSGYETTRSANRLRQGEGNWLDLATIGLSVPLIAGTGASIVSSLSEKCISP